MVSPDDIHHRLFGNLGNDILAVVDTNVVAEDGLAPVYPLRRSLPDCLVSRNLRLYLPGEVSLLDFERLEVNLPVGRKTQLHLP